MDFFGWVSSLSPSGASFLGALIGVGGGLISLLVGALVNAALNRRRDNRLRTDEAISIAASVRGELAAIRVSIEGQLPLWREAEREFRQTIRHINPTDANSREVDAAEYAKLPPSYTPIFEGNASKLGLLGAELAGAISVIYTNYRARAAAFEKPFQIAVTQLPEHFVQQIRWGEKFCKDCEEFERLLVKFERTGQRDGPGARTEMRNLRAFWSRLEIGPRLQLVQIGISALGFVAAIAAVSVAIHVFNAGKEFRRDDAIVRAWTLLSQAPLVQANIGVGSALEFLLSQKQDLRRLRLERAWLNDITLNGINLQWSTLQGTLLNHSQLRRALLNPVCLKGADIQGTKFNDAQMQDSNLRGAYLNSGTDLAEADVRGADFRGAHGLSCEILVKARNWQFAFRDPNLECGGQLIEGQIDPNSNICP